MTHTTRQHLRLAMRVAWISLIGNFVLFAGKYWAGHITGSVALIADAWHTLSDSVSSLIVIWGLHVARQPADQLHPYGHGRAELIASVALGTLLGIISINFFIESIERLISGEVIQYGWQAIVITALSVLGKEAMAQYSIRAGKKYQSASLKADGWHHRSDALSSVVVLIGIFLGRFAWWIDGTLGLLVSVLIAVTAFEILKQSSSNLLGEKADPALIKRIKQLADPCSVYEVFLHDIQLHEYGYQKELTCHIRLPGHMSLEEAHDIATRIENTIEAELGISTNIHVDAL